MIQSDIIRLDNELDTGLELDRDLAELFRDYGIQFDQIYLIESSTGDIECQQTLGRNEEEMEGLQTPLIIGDTLYVTFALSGRMEEISLQLLQSDCTLNSRTLNTTLGQIPNDLDHVRDELWVTMSGENHILRLDQETGDEIDRIILPVGSNPGRSTSIPLVNLGRLVCGR